MDKASEELGTPQARLLLDVMVPMRDDVHLATDVYFAPDTWASTPLPVILERTPYDKSGVSRSESTVAEPRPVSRPDLARYFAAQGYVVVMQDCRGRYRSEGEFHKYLNEPEDGFDTVQWILAQPWCNGRIGTMGLSYGAHVQSALASLNPPGLACMFMDSGGFSSAFHGGIRRGGAFELKQATWAFKHALLSPATTPGSEREKRLQQTDISDWFRNMPWRPGHSPLSAAPEFESYLFEQWQAGTFTDYWQQRGLYAEGYYDQFPNIPTAIVGSWYDPYVQTCITNFTELSKRHSARVALIMGPWTHGDRSVTWSGDVDFGVDATLDGSISTDYRTLRLDWFRRCLKDDDQAIDVPAVRYFQMGGGSGLRNADGRLEHGGRWMEAQQWPPSATQQTTFYLGVGGTLTSTIDSQSKKRHYVSDPENPVPTIGGSLTSGEPVMRGGAFDQVVTDSVFTYRGEPVGKALAERPDVLVFETDVLQENLIVTGEIIIELFVSSDCPDTDFTAKLIDVYPPNDDYPDGYAMNITDGIFRMRYRDGFEKTVTMQADEVYRVRIEPFATSNLFQAGHRLRIDIASSNYPQFDINPNTGAPEGRCGEGRVAHNTVYVGGAYASRVLLPVSRQQTA